MESKSDSMVKNMVKFKSGPDDLTSREYEILQLIASEKTSVEIGIHLHVGLETIRTYRKSLLSKLQVRNTAGLIRKAFEMGLLKL